MPPVRSSRPAASGRFLPIACLALLSACDNGSRQAASPAREHPVAATQAVPLVDGRIRFEPKRRPVVVAPDGSRRTIASMLDLPGEMAFGDFAWNDTSTPDAPVWIRVDLARQLLSVFRGADEIGAAVIIYGTDGMDTPSGVFPVRGKELMHRSRAYDADMPFTLWLTADGVAIHASSVERGRATHGCVGVPAGFAEKLFGAVQKGDPVIVLPAATTA